MKKLLIVIIILMLAFASVTIVACEKKGSADIFGGNTNGNEVDKPDGDSTEKPDGDQNENPDGDVEEATATGIKVNGDILTDKVILKGTELTGLEVVVSYSDGTESDPVAVDASMIGGYDKDVAGYQTVKVNYRNFEKEFEVLVADVIISKSAELENAIKAQQDGQTWAILGGTYDVVPDEVTEIRGQTGWYFAVTANDLKIYGMDKPTITSTATSENGNWSKQNLITVFGNNVEFHGMNFVAKSELNKVIEVVGGDNFVLSDCTINAPEEEPGFAGTVYFNEFSGKTATLKNVEMNYGRISTRGCDNTSVIVMNNVGINFADAKKQGFDEPGYSTESYYWAIFNTAQAEIRANNCVVTVSEGASKHKEYKSWFVDYLPESGIELVIVSEGKQENVAYVADENQLEQAAVASEKYSEYEIIFTEDINWAKSDSTVLYVDGVTISLNNKTLSGANMAMIFQGNNFTIKDGTVRVTNSGNYALFIGDLTHTTGVVVENVTMEGGINVYNAQVTLKNCTITATNYHAVWCDSKAQVVVESGTYKVGTGKNVLGMGVTSSPEDGEISLAINGGTYISENNLVLSGNNQNGYPYGSPVINAGVFSENPAAYVNTGTSEITETDGKYYVTVK